MKRNRKTNYLLIIIFVFGVPFVIHCLFKLQSSCDFFVAEWSAGDILSYYGTVTLGLITIYLACVANNTNKRLLEIDEMERKAFLKLNLYESKIDIEDTIKFIEICFENTTDNLIVDFSIEGSEKLLLKTNWRHNQESENGIVVTKFESITGRGLIEEDKKLVYTLAVKKYNSPFLLISFRTVCKSVYGLVSTQVYNIVLTNDVFNGYKTVVEDIEK